MKRIILSFITSIAMLAFFTNCNDDDDPHDFSMYPSTVVIGVDGGADFIEIRSNSHMAESQENMRISKNKKLHGFYKHII